MIANEMGLIQAYDVLGVSAGSTLVEIRSAYRKLARELHPDIAGADPAIQERFKQVALAYEVLSKYLLMDLDEELTSPDEQAEEQVTETEVQLGNFYCKLRLFTRTVSAFYGSYATREAVLAVPLEYFRQQPNREDFYWRNLGFESFVSLKIDVIDSRRGVLFTTSEWHWSHDYERYQRSLDTQDHSRALGSLESRLSAIPNSRVTAASTWVKLSKARTKLRSYVTQYGWSSDKKLLLQAIELIRTITRECERLEGADVSELYVDTLMDGRLSSVAHQHNLDVVQQVNAASVRTDGLVDVIDEQDLRDFYMQKISEHGVPTGSIVNAEFFLKYDDYVPEGVLDPDFGAAPETVLFSSNKGQASYDVTYRYIDSQPTAIVRLPLKVFERHAPQHGRRHRFPEMPHGIRWACEVTYDERVIASGLVDDKLVASVDKWQRGHRRAKHADRSDTLLDSLYGTAVSGVPPWYVGKARPGRRK